MNLNGNQVAVQAVLVALCALGSSAAHAQAAYLPTQQKAYSQFSEVRTPMAMQAQLAALLQGSQQPASIVVSAALTSGLSPSQVLRATSASVPGKLPEVVTSLAMLGQSQLDAATLIQQVSQVAPAQLEPALRAFAAGKPDLLPSAVAAAVSTRPDRSAELVSVGMAAAARQQNGATLVRSIHASAIQANPAMALTYTALGMGFTSGSDADAILQLGVAVAGVPSSAGGAIVCTAPIAGKQPAAGQCKLSEVALTMVRDARNQQNARGPAVEATVAQVVAQTAPLQGLVGGGLVGGAAGGAPGLIGVSGLVGTSAVDPNLVSTGTTP